MIILIKNTCSIIKKNLFNLIVFNLIYHIASLIVVYNFFSASISFALKQAGYSFITAENIMPLLKQPVSIALIIANILIILIFAYIELVCLLENYRASLNTVKLSAYNIFLAGLLRITKIIKEGNILNIIPGLLILPFICIHFIVLEFLNVKVVNYIGQYIYDSFKNEEILYLIIAVTVILSLFSAFIIPLVVFGGKSLRQAVIITRNVVSKKANKTWFYIIIWNGLLSVGIYAIYILLILICTLFISMTASKDAAIAEILLAGEWLEFLMAVVSSIVGMAGNMAFIYSIYTLYGFSEPCKDEGIIEAYAKLADVRIQKITAVLCTAVFCIEMIYSFRIFDNSTKIAQEIFVSTQITAHRGGSAYAPENTIAALNAAIEVKSDYAEIDVQETKDGVVVLMHDSNLKRTTGFNGYIWDMTYEELMTLDAGSKFGKEFAGEKIPTLGEAIQLCKGKMLLNVEIKSNGHNEDIVKNVLNIIMENEAERSCVITSMDYKLLTEVKEQNPDMRTGYILKMAYGDFENRVDADFLSIKHTYATKKVITAAHNSGKEVHVWTVNSRSDIERMKLLDVDNIITDRPVTARQVLSSEKTSAGFADLLEYLIK